MNENESTIISVDKCLGEIYFGSIYLISFKNNNLKYIGATTRSLKDRMKGHFYEAQTRFNSQLKLSKLHSNLINKTEEDIDVSLLKKCKNAEELAYWENYYIRLLDTIESGLNSINGGGFLKPVYQFEPNNNEYIAKFDSIHEASWLINTNYKTISNACLGSLKSAKGYLWSYVPEYPNVEDKRSKKVYQYSLGGVLINEFNSAREASRQLGIGLSSITRCCRGERKQTSGCKFRY